MLKGHRIALVEDDAIMGASLVQRLTLEGAEVIWLKLAARAIGALRTPRAPIDAVICDIRLPDGTGEELFATLCRTTTPPPFLFITGQGGIEQAVRLLRAGASDYITKPFEMATFLDRLAALMRQSAMLQPGRSRLPPILGPSPAAQRIEAQIAAAAQSDRPVLIRGGPGTGKALIARRIHSLSDRSAAALVHVNIARATAPGAMLFGPEGATFLVGDGVLFLNGLEHLDEADQARLNRWLDQRPPARIIAACGQDVAQLVRTGAFRRDLWARLDLIDIPVPPLSDRPDDAVWLLHQLFASLNPRRGVPLRGISALAEAAVRGHDWPDNGRELRSRLVQALGSATGDWLFPADLFPERQAEGAGMQSLSETRDAAERAQIVTALGRTGGQVAEAARLLKVSRTTLWEKMQKLGL